MKKALCEDPYTLELNGESYEVKPFLEDEKTSLQYNVFEEGGEFLFSLFKNDEGAWQADTQQENPVGEVADFDENLPSFIGLAIEEKEQEAVA